jgi:predicted transcriptional regulator
MSTVTLKVSDLSAAMTDFKQVWMSGSKEPEAITFASWDLMHKTLSPKRLEIIRSLCGQEPMSIRELSRRVGRDFKGVYTDVTSLIAAGLIDQCEGKIGFPYDRIHVEFDIEAAA